MIAETPSERFSIVLPIAFCVAIIISGLLFMLNLLFLKRNTKKQYLSSNAMQTKANLVINDEKITETSSFSSINLEWQDIYKATESKSGIYLFFSKLQAIVIPKRLLTSQEEDTLRTIITANLDAEKNKLKK